MPVDRALDALQGRQTPAFAPLAGAAKVRVSQPLRVVMSSACCCWTVESQAKSPPVSL